MSSLLSKLPPDLQQRLVKRDQPAWIAPMLATLYDHPFSDDKWLFERKLDGERCLAFRRGEEVFLYSRNRKPLNANYPELVVGLWEQPGHDFVVDGEIVAFAGAQTSFARLQPRMQTRDPYRALSLGIPVFFYIFDLLHLDGHDLTRLPLRERKRLLRRLIAFADPLRFLPHRNGQGEAFYHEACARGWEGVVAKRADSRYSSVRSREWLKLKCILAQELVVGGYTDPLGKRKGLGALLVGFWREGRLIYAGKVGTGYSEATLSNLSRTLGEIERPTSPFAPALDLPRRGVHWVEPHLVAQVGFSEWTDEGRLRHPRFLGLRTDKQAGEVVRETPAAIEAGGRRD